MRQSAIPLKHAKCNSTQRASKKGWWVEKDYWRRPAEQAETLEPKGLTAALPGWWPAFWQGGRLRPSPQSSWIPQPPTAWGRTPHTRLPAALPGRGCCAGPQSPAFCRPVPPCLRLPGRKWLPQGPGQWPVGTGPGLFLQAKLVLRGFVPGCHECVWQGPGFHVLSCRQLTCWSGAICK